MTRTQRLDSDHVREANAQRLCAVFETITFKDGEWIDDFTVRTTGLATSLRSLGDIVGDGKVIRKLLSVIPRFTQVAISIETLIDLSTLSIEESLGVCGWSRITTRTAGETLAVAAFFSQKRSARRARVRAKAPQAAAKAAAESRPHPRAN